MVVCTRTANISPESLHSLVLPPSEIKTRDKVIRPSFVGYQEFSVRPLSVCHAYIRWLCMIIVKNRLLFSYVLVHLSARC